MMRFRAILGVLSLTLLRSVTAIGAEQADVAVPAPVRDVLNQVMGFLYTAAHWFGQALSDMLAMIWPAVTLPLEIVDSVGFLALITAFLVLAEVARKLAWIVLGVGWVLIVTRIIVLLFNPPA